MARLFSTALDQHDQAVGVLLSSDRKPFSFSRRSVRVKGGSLQMGVGVRLSESGKNEVYVEAFPDEKQIASVQRRKQSSMAPRWPRTVLYRARRTTDER
jgi:hypothetical protein